MPRRHSHHALPRVFVWDLAQLNPPLSLFLSHWDVPCMALLLRTFTLRLSHKWAPILITRIVSINQKRLVACSAV